ncbi:MAG TPA: histidine kinase dimerization/phospho-acceptor domain-containing protein, partial [Usitatibacter sp.]|nr:histidine kinase dimerization/phospho-acceptor domain-containing protein [Usitatibacter sp.]
WVVDARSRVRGLSGALPKAPEPTRAITHWLKPLAALVVPAPRVPAAGDETRPARSQVDRALIGVSSTEWRATPDRDVAILSAAQPIFVGDDIVGAVVVEETTGSIQILKESALENLLALTLAVVAAALAILLLFATRLAARIRRLHAEAEGAIDPQGRVAGAITPTDAKDEIGDLTRTTAAMLSRLKDYNAYLEAMAGRLSHELRTPVAVVRSSLDNLQAQALPAEARVYVERAGEGVDRLARLISRLSQATRLERMLESAERERFDLAAVVAGCVEGYRAAYPARAIEYAPPPGPIATDGVPDAFAELLDKLVENANDFAPAGTRGAGTTSAASGFSQCVMARVGSGALGSAPESPRTRDLASTTHTREERRPAMERKRSISSDGTYALPRLATALGSAAAKSATMRRRSSSSSLAADPAAKSAGRSERPAAIAREVAAIDCSWASRRNASILEMNCTARAGSARSTSAAMTSRKRIPCTKVARMAAGR